MMFQLDQYQAAKTQAAIVDRSDRGLIGVGGADRVSFLHSLLSNDIEHLKVGTGCYATYLTPQGRMISDMRVLNVGDELLLDVPAATEATLLTRFGRSIFTEDVRVSDRSATLAIFGVHGPKAAEAFAAEDGCQSVAGELLALDEHDNRRMSLGGVELLLARNDDLGVPGFDVYVERSQAPLVHRALRVAGVGDMSAETSEVLRVETGRPRWGADMDEDTIPLEAGIEDRAISLTKGCYVGQEVIVRILHRGHGRVARRLVGLTIDANSPMARGDTIRGADKDIGHVTSAVVSPALGRSIALGYVQRDFVAPGRMVAIVHDGRKVSATVSRGQT